MRPPFLLGDQSVAPGSRETLHLTLPEFYTHAPATMPMHVIHGRQDGPCVLITSTIHGDEINGVEIVRRLLTQKSINKLHGTLILIPVVNVFGFVSQSRYLPDRRDLNRSFPGSAKGSMAARLAFLISQEILPSCTHVIDLHTGAIGRENLPQIRTTFPPSGEGSIVDLALSFNAPVVLDAALRPGTFRESAHSQGIPSLVYEAGEALRFDEVSIRAGVTGTLNVLAHLGMIRKRTKRSHSPVIAKSSFWVRAPQSGVLRSLIALGIRVKKGEVIAYVSDPIGEHEEEITSPAAGIVIGRARLPLVHEGEAVFHIASFSQTGNAAEQVVSFQDEFDPETGTPDSDEPPLIG